MGNPIVETTEAFLAELSADVKGAYEEAASDYAARVIGQSFALGEILELFKGAKVLAAADGFSKAEIARLYQLMEAHDVPRGVQDHVRTFEIGGVTREHMAQLFPSGSPKARYLVSLALAVAAADGLSDEERVVAERLGEELGLHKKMVHALAAVAIVSKRLLEEPDRVVGEQLAVIRRCLLELP